MPRCELTAKSPVVKNLVSHSNIKTKSRAFPNIKMQTLYSQSLKKNFRLRVAVSTLRTLERRGGLDTFILKQSRETLSPRARVIKKAIRTKLMGYGSLFDDKDQGSEKK